MKVIKKIMPGKNGSKQYAKLYGSQLVCVRYRRDEKKKIRYTTIELIVDEGPYFPVVNDVRKIVPHDGQIVYIQTDIDETHIHLLLSQNGAKWIPSKRVWKVRHKTVKQLGLVDRIVQLENAFSKTEVS